MACTVTFAQTFKGSPTKAKAYLDKGDLANAKGEIEAFLNGEKFKKKPKASGYLLQGEIYKAIAMSDKPEDKTLLDDPIKKALEAFDKVKGMTKESAPEYKKIFIEQGLDYTTGTIKPGIIDEFRNFYFDKGAKLYNEGEDFEGAMEAFESCYHILPGDTLAAYYAFSCAAAGDNKDGMLRNLDKLYETKYPKAFPYTAVARVYYEAGNELLGDEKKEQANVEFQKMLDVATKGREIVPSSVDLMKFQIEAYIRLDKAGEAIGLLQETVKENPNDSVSYFSMGALYEKQENYEMAEKSYKKALAIAPNYYDANLNVAAYYLERAKDINRQINDLIGPTGRYTDEAKAESLEKEKTELYKTALVYLEKCESISPDPNIGEKVTAIKAQLERE